MYVICAAWLLAATAPDPVVELRSPAVEAASAVLASRPHAEDEVWRDLSRRGLPLVEDHPDNPALKRVTFAFQGHDSITGVRLDSVVNAPYVRGEVSDYVRDFTLPLQRLGETQIWTLTLDVERDVAATYSFLVELTTGTRRMADSENRRRLRGVSAETVLMLAPREADTAIRPVPFMQRRPGDALAIDSEALGRTVLLQHHAVRNPPAAAPVVVIWDSFLWGVRAPAWEIVQNLVDQGRMPPAHVVLIDQLDPESADRRYQDQSAFIGEELQPFLAEKGMTGPLILAGASRRGLAATLAALDNPDQVDGAISMSGSFYWSPQDEEPEWLARSLEPAAASAPRFILNAGSLEYVVTSTNQGHVMQSANHNMTEALSAAGYDAVYREFSGGHDMAGWRGALASSLDALFEDVETASALAD
ncbi:alpha/beta hydrolase-fold protein [Maricaulis sp.]|uniref:alpha/beta hydrolase-fold protein n=1 Tax=Maricaulis sp. TaxID=1486257 RepID=UPI00262D4217|nr:alpha/beta hydrolase-fold protein [Maricaulis sp.]